jgi:hypothetical protein
MVRGEALLRNRQNARDGLAIAGHDQFAFSDHELG